MDRSDALIEIDLFESHGSEGSHGSSERMTDSNDVVVWVDLELLADDGEGVGGDRAPTVGKWRSTFRDAIRERRDLRCLESLMHTYCLCMKSNQPSDSHVQY